MDEVDFCDGNEVDDFVLVNYPADLSKPSILSNEDCKGHRICPLTAEAFQQFLDDDGRLVDEHRFRQAVFRGGVTPSMRKTVWKYLFQMYPFHSTKRERNILLAEYHMKYRMMKNSWKSLSTQNGNSNVQVSDYSTENKNETFEPSFYDEMKNILEMDDEEAGKQLNWMEVQAKIDMKRTGVINESILKYFRIIDKDVPRTDRDMDFLKGEGNPNLELLRNILRTYVYHHPEIGYSQGMNDHLSRFLYVLESEAEAYWCFSYFLQQFHEDFMEEGMTRKIELLEILLHKTDPDLYQYIKASEIGNLTFCHRWLILMFKREFDVEDGVRLFEIISSHHLEMNSMEANQARESGRWKEMRKEETSIGLRNDLINAELTFDLFICVTLLIENRQMLFKANNSMDFITCTKIMVHTISLDELLKKSEEIFYNYCQLSVVDSFVIL